VAATVLAIESLVFISVHVKFREIAPIILSGGEARNPPTPTDSREASGATGPNIHRLTEMAIKEVGRLDTLGKRNRRRSWVSGNPAQDASERLIWNRKYALPGRRRLRRLTNDAHILFVRDRASKSRAVATTC
jgi:hypothetical protein